MSIPVSKLDEAQRPLDERILDLLGIDIRPRGAALALALAPSVPELQPFCFELEVAARGDPEREIEALYSELRRLAQGHDEVRYRACLERLHELEDAEAEQMKRYFDAHDPLPRALVDDVDRKIDALLKRLEDRSSSDAPPDRAD